MITISQKGEFDVIESYLKRLKKHKAIKILHKYGKLGVEELAAATPVDTGKTASSWSYNIRAKYDRLYLEFNNSNFNKGVPIAIVLQYGHLTRNKGWVEGRDYINPAMKKIFDQMLNELWKEVTKV